MLFLVIFFNRKAARYHTHLYSKPILSLMIPVFALVARVLFSVPYVGPNPSSKNHNHRSRDFLLKDSLLRPWRERLNCLGPMRSAFTLVELMAVIGIVALLAVVGVPAIKGLTGSGGRKQALAQVLGALEVARNTAISSGTNAAVIFPDSTFAFGEAFKYRSMAVVTWNPTNSADPATMVGPWIVFPQGIALFPKSLSSTNLPTATNISVRILSAPPNKADFPAVIFQPDGGLDENSPICPTNGVAFFEGTVTGTTVNKNSRMTNFETIRLTRYTGRAFPTLAPAP